MYNYIYICTCLCMFKSTNQCFDWYWSSPCLYRSPHPHALTVSRERAPSAQILDDVLRSRYRCQVGVKQNKQLNIKYSVSISSKHKPVVVFIHILSRLELPNIQQPSSAINIWWILSSNWIATKTSGRSACSESTSMGGNLGINVHCVVFTNSSSWKSHTEQTEFPTAPTNDVLVHLPSAEGRWENSCSDLVDWCGPTNGFVWK